MTCFDFDALNEPQRYLAEFLGSAHHKDVCPFVQKHGKLFTPSPLPKGIRGGKASQCFANSYRLLRRHGKRLGLVYAEGYAIHPMIKKPAYLHAWCVDRNGSVYDPTWKNGDAYFGIEFKREFVFDTLAQREANGDLYFGFLDDWENRLPLIHTLGSQPEIWRHNWQNGDENNRSERKSQKPR